MGCPSKRRPWTRSVSSSVACPPWGTCGGRGCGTMCTTWPARQWGRDGLKRCCCRCCIGNSTRPAHAARDVQPRCDRRCRPGTTRVRRTRSPSRWHPMCLRIGKRGRQSVPQPFSGPHRQSKGATALWRRCITTIGVCQSAAARFGPCYITSIVAPQMGQHQPRGFSGDRFPTSLRPWYRKSMTCLGLGNAIRPWRSVVDAI